jgi:hypothetical protein
VGDGVELKQSSRAAEPLQRHLLHKTGTVLPSPDAISDETLVSFANFWEVLVIMDGGGQAK